MKEYTILVIRFQNILFCRYCGMQSQLYISKPLTFKKCLLTFYQNNMKKNIVCVTQALNNCLGLFQHEDPRKPSQELGVQSMTIHPAFYAKQVPVWPINFQNRQFFLTSQKCYKIDIGDVFASYEHNCTSASPIPLCPNFNKFYGIERAIRCKKSLFGQV